MPFNCGRRGGTAMFTLLRGFDGAGINEAAGRILGLSRNGRSGSAARRGGPDSTGPAT